MSDLRLWVQNALENDAGLLAVIDGRVFQGQSMTTSQVKRPFLVHRFGNDTDENLAEVDAYPHRQFFSVWIHDDPGDYILIDAIIGQVKQAFRLAPRPVGVVGLRFLEASADFSDPTFKTIFRYARFQFVVTS